jgi:tetratricopeptide (TPR) repeat protein
MKPTTLLWCAAAFAACANIDRPTTTDDPKLATARQLLASDPHRALALCDTLLTEQPDNRAVRLMLAEGSLQLARTATENNGSYYEDAARHFERGLAGTDDRQHARELGLWAECSYELARFEQGSAIADRAASAFGDQKNPTTETRQALAKALLIGGRCEMQQFVSRRREEVQADERDAMGKVPAAPATLQLAQKAGARFAAARTELPAEAVPQLAAIQQWLGQDSEVLRELEAGIAEAPTATPIHDAYIQWLADQNQHDALVGSYARMVKARPTTTVLLWHQGRALYRRADRMRHEGNFHSARLDYTKADASFQQYLGLAPQHREGASEWRALCALSTARVAVEMGDLAAAQEQLQAAGELSPKTLAYDGEAPQLADSFGSHYASVVFAISRAASEGGDDALANTLAFNEAVLQQAPERFGFVYNNAALAARDLGVQKAQAGQAEAAKELWERSYRYYDRAVALSPDDPRIANDCGLMLLYHLDRSHDRAEQLFAQAIELGKAQLAALPPSGADAAEQQALAAQRQYLEEATGDALQNLALLRKDHGQQPFAVYAPLLEQAVTYYPNQRREAAAMLRQGGDSTPASTQRGAAPTNAVTSGAASSDPQGGAAEALAKKKAAVQQKRDAADFDSALGLLDEIEKECKDHAPYHLLRGEVSLQLANQALGQQRRGTQLFFQDAVRSLQRAVELDPEPAAPRQLLAQAMYENNDPAGATATLSALLLHLQSQGGGKPEDIAAAHLLRANAAARGYAKAKGQQQDDKELLTAARLSFRYLEEKGKLDGELQKTWAATERWGGANAEAVNVYLRGLDRKPEDAALLEAALNTAGEVEQLPLFVEAVGNKKDATSIWYSGKGRFWLAGELQKQNKLPEALAMLDQAHQDFAASMQQNPAYRESSEQWQALALGKKGMLAFRAKDYDNAEKWLLAAAKARPDQIATPLAEGESIKLGILLLGDYWYRQQNLGKVESIYRAATDAANSDLDLLNNAALFARDYGNEIENNDSKAAMALYEQSYKAYSRAHQLDPSNVRLRNDVALIAIYHLERDWDLAKQRLDSAIADGEKTLKENPPDDANQKQKLEEAVGDCYENLALWNLKHKQDGAAAKAAAQASQRFYPGERRPGARRHLQAAERLLQGK